MIKPTVCHGQYFHQSSRPVALLTPNASIQSSIDQFILCTDQFAASMSRTALSPPESELTSARDIFQFRAEPVNDTEAARCLASMSSSSVNVPLVSTPAPVSTSTPAPATGGKPTRLSLACNPCRKRKVRCDARQPKCQNCTLRGDVCETSDLRRPGAPAAARKRATRRHSGAVGAKASRGQIEQQPEQQPQQPYNDDSDDVPPEPAPLSPEASSSLPLDNRQQSQPNVSISPAGGVPTDNTASVHYSLGLGLQARPSSSRADRESARTHWSSSSPGTTRSAGEPGELSRQPQTRSRRPGPDHFSWLSRAYRDTTVAQVQNSKPADDSTEVEQSDTVVVTPDVVVNTDGSPNRLKVLGGSSLQCLFNFADLWLAGYGYDLTAPLFRHGMSSSEEFYMPLQLSLPDLPERPVLTECVDAFFGRVWPLFPIVDRSAVDAEVEDFLDLQYRDSRSLQDKVQPARVPGLAMLYAIVCIGMNEMPRTGPGNDHDSSLEIKKAYLTACYSLHGHLTATPYHSSVQAMLLLALALRSQAKDGQSWHITGQAIRMAVSLGLNKWAERQIAVRNSTAPLVPSATPYNGGLQQQRQQQQNDDSLRERLWWSCFALERLLQLECGRPSSIDPDYDNLALNCGLGANEHNVAVDEEGRETAQEPTFMWFTAWVSLAGIMGQISDRLYSHRFSGSGEMLSETARQARCLTEWEAALPEQLRPRNTFFAETDNNHVLAVFLSQQYYHAQIAVLRSAIIFPEKGFIAEVKKRSMDTPEISRLLGGVSMCVQAARNLVMQTLQLADAGVQSILLGLPQTFLASVVLALSILRAPTSTLARSDVELLTAATEYVEGHYRHWGFHTSFVAILPRLRDRVKAVFRQDVKLQGLSLPRPGARQDGTANGQERDMAVTGVRSAAMGFAMPTPIQALFSGGSTFLPMDHGEGAQNSLAPSQNMEGLGMTGEPGIEAFIGMEFEQLWNMMDADMILDDMGDQFGLT